MSVSSPGVDSDGDWYRGRRFVPVGGASVALVGVGMTALSATIIDPTSASVSLDLDRGGRRSKKTCLEVDARDGGLRPS